MSSGTLIKDVKTFGLVLRRTNYGEADRVLNIITPEGKMAVMAKGVRKAKSRLAGAVEMFTLSDLMVHFGRGEMGTLTGARMVRHYGEIVKDLAKLELASLFLKMINKVADSVDSEDYYNILDQALMALNDGVKMDLVEAWFRLNLRQASGDEINLYCDNEGRKLKADCRYEWDDLEEVFNLNEFGKCGADEIKMLRLMTANDYNVVKRVKIDDATPQRILQLVRRVI